MLLLYLSAVSQSDKTNFYAGVSIQPPIAAGSRLSLGLKAEGKFLLKNNDALSATAVISTISFFTTFDEPSLSKCTVLPIMFGYSKNIKQIFIGPRLGYGVFSKTVIHNEADLNRTFIDGAFFYGVQAGYNLKRFVFFMEFQGLQTINSSSLYPDYKQFAFGGAGIAFKLK